MCDNVIRHIVYNVVYSVGIDMDWQAILNVHNAHVESVLTELMGWDPTDMQRFISIGYPYATHNTMHACTKVGPTGPTNCRALQWIGELLYWSACRIHR